MSDILEHNRVILCHFDTYSAASLYARYGSSVLVPSPLPEGAAPASPPQDISENHEPEKVKEAICSRYGLDPAVVNLAEGFDEWMEGGNGPIRIHLAKFIALDPPKEEIAASGGTMKPISEMRGIPMAELSLLRSAFNLVMSGG